jgi:putative hydrolase of the HAD superfamily
MGKAHFIMKMMLSHIIKLHHYLRGDWFMNQQTLILDLDDTLIHCNKYFQQSKMELVKKLQGWFKTLTYDEIIQKQIELDLKSVEEHGLHSSRYPETLVETYAYFCKKFNRKMKETEIDVIRIIGRKVFEIEVEPFPYMYKVLEELQEEGHHLFLFTGGDAFNQYRKIFQLGLEKYFNKGIFIFKHKNTRALKSVLTKIRSNKKTTWMIGNSLKTDIKPAIELGINAIHIPSEIEWSYNIVDIEIEPRGTFAELKSLIQLPDFLSEQSFQYEFMPSKC